MDVNSKINRLADILEEIQPDQATLLVGPNASGKSVIRKQLASAVPRKVDDEDISVHSISMQNLIAFGDAADNLGSFSRQSMGLNTWKSLKSFVERYINAEHEIPAYLVIDDPEIGLSAEAQVVVAEYLERNLDRLLEMTRGLLISTHSELIVGILKDKCCFIDISCPGRTADAWLDRELVPLDLDQLYEESMELFSALKSG